MSSIPWMPSLVLLADAGYDWNTYLDIVYQFFRKDFVESSPFYTGVPLKLKRYPLRDGREATFWHLVTEGDTESHRVPDEIRCERIRWPRPIIEHVPCSEIRCWHNRRGSEERIVLALADYSYVVILAMRSGYLLPWTAYSVERNHHRRKLQREFQQYQKMTGAATK